MNYLIHQLNRIIQRIVFFLVWLGALIATLLASVWGIEAGQL